jgi:hypothetical protein
MKTLNYLWLLLLALGLYNCTQPPDYPVEPVIFPPEAGRILNRQAIVQGSTTAPFDTLVVTFGFTDGDGDIGTRGDSLDVFLTDSRDGFVNFYKLPVIPQQGAGNGISGEVTLRIPNKPFNICCTFPDGSTACQPNQNFPTDRYYYTIQIRDQANNFSNELDTEELTVLCN